MSKASKNLYNKNMKTMVQLYQNCHLCPRRCGANRSEGQLGVCQAPPAPKVAKTMLHHWEEPCLSGERGSGALFFSHCNLKCIYCQNHRISHGGQGNELSVEALAAAIIQLQSQGAHNINLVSPTPYLPSIIAGLTLAQQNGLTVPVVYNTNGYELPEQLERLAGLVNIFLPDLKYHSPAVSAELSGVTDYFTQATAAIETMLDLVGPPQFDDAGMLTQGLIIRHLVLPNHLEESRQVLRWIRRSLPPTVYISLMAQYFPTHQAGQHPSLNRRLTQAEYDAIVDECLDLGLENGFIQELDSADEKYVPEF